MKHKIGIMLEGFKKPLKESLELASSIGADGIQLSAIADYAKPLDYNRLERKELKNIISSYGLEISAVCGDLGGHGFTGLDNNEYKISTSKKILDLALELGVNIVTTHIGVIPSDKSGYYQTLLKACNDLAKYAEESNAFFAIETGPETPETLLMFLNDLSYSGMGVNYDPANLVMVTGVDPVLGVNVLSKKIVHTHAKDGIMLKKTDPKVIYDFFAEGGIGDLRMEDYFKELPLGQGNVNLTGWIKALDAVGYTGYLTIEREVGLHPVEDIKLAIDTLRDIMSKDN